MPTWAEAEAANMANKAAVLFMFSKHVGQRQYSTQLSDHPWEISDPTIMPLKWGQLWHTIESYWSKCDFWGIADRFRTSGSGIQWMVRSSNILASSQQVRRHCGHFFRLPSLRGFEDPAERIRSQRFQHVALQCFQSFCDCKLRPYGQPQSIPKQSCHVEGWEMFDRYHSRLAKPSGSRSAIRVSRGEQRLLLWQDLRVRD
jgi:hypothetical protein